MKTLHFVIIGIIFSLILFSTASVYAASILVIKTDKIVYVNSDKPIIIIYGSPFSKVELEIDDPDGNTKLSRLLDISKDGIANYTLDVSWYRPGVYSANAITSTSKATASFAVGLASPFGAISLDLVKYTYLPGDSIIILGSTHPNSIIRLSLIDSKGTVVKSLQTFSDKFGHFSSFDFSIPPTAVLGSWKVEAASGVAHKSVEIKVNSLTSTVTQNDSNVTIIEKNMTISKHPSHVVTTLSPLKQFKSGTSAQNVKCKEGLQLVIKAEDGSPACVWSDTAQTLIKREWGKFTTSTDGVNNQEKNGTLSGVVSAYVYGGPLGSSQNQSVHYEIDVYATDGITIVGKTLSDANAHYSIQLPAGNYIIYTYNDPKQSHLVSVYSGKNTIFDISSSISVP